MRSVLPLIPLLLVLVPLSCVRVYLQTPKFTCEKAVKALRGKDVFQRPKKVSGDRKSLPPDSPWIHYSCPDKDKTLTKPSTTIRYGVQDHKGVLYILNLDWHRNIRDSHMTSVWDLADTMFKMPEHPNLLNMKRFVQSEVDADGDPVKDGRTKSSKDTWHVYYTLMEFGQQGSLGYLLLDNPEYASNAPWVGRTLFKIAQAIKHLHTHGNIHTRIALKNVFFDADFEPKLFTKVKPARQGTPGKCQGFLWTAAPEVLALRLTLKNNDGFTWSEKQDTYSLGALMIQMLDFNEIISNQKDLPAPGTRDSAKVLDPQVKAVFDIIENGEFKVRSGVPFWAIKVMHGLLQFSPESRWGVDKILEELINFSTKPANPGTFQAPATGSQLTVDTPICIPEGSKDKFIKISTKQKFKEPEDFVAQKPEVLKRFSTAFPSFLYDLTGRHRFNLVR